MIGAIPIWETAQTINTTAVLTSEPISQTQLAGFGAFLVIVTGTTPSLDITCEVSMSTTNTFYTPYDVYGTSLGEIATTLDATRWTFFPVPLGPYIRFVITGDVSNGADTTVKAWFIAQEKV